MGGYFCDGRWVEKPEGHTAPSLPPPEPEVVIDVGDYVLHLPDTRINRMYADEIRARGPVEGRAMADKIRRNLVRQELEQLARFAQ